MKDLRTSVVSSFASVLAILASSTLLFAWMGSVTASGQSKETSALAVACSPDLPIVRPSDVVDVRAWATPESNSLEYSWTATGGKLSGQGVQQSWSFKDVMPALYHATVKVKGASGVTAECTVQVFVEEDLRLQKPPARDTGRSFLTKAKREEEGYGLYSYILFGSPPTDSSRQRYLGTIEAYRRLIPKIEDLEDSKNRDRNELNVTYLPVDVVPTSAISAEAIVDDHYDYARARKLLDKIPGDHLNGPYIISTLRPLSQVQSLSGQYLFQDLSHVPPSPKELTSWWVREFLSQAAQENFWEERTGQQLVLRLRTTISVLAEGSLEVRGGLSTTIEWLH